MGTKYEAALGGTTLTDQGAKKLDSDIHKQYQAAAKRRMQVTYKKMPAKKEQFPGQTAVGNFINKAADIPGNYVALAKRYGSSSVKKAMK